MRKILFLLLASIVGFLAACSDDSEAEGDMEELVPLEVDFIVPETADPGETVELEAVVTYGEENVEDADEVAFEYWLSGNEDDSITIEGEHTENGSYVAEVTFEEDGIYEMYAHTTARGLHTMPLKSITVGEGGEAVHEEEHDDHEEDEEGFHIHFMKPEALAADSEADLIAHLHLDGESFENAEVRYEISPEGHAENTVWLDAEETAAGEYTASHRFAETGKYKIVIHVEDDSGLHEHDEHVIEVE